jgi:DNA transformation protein
VFLAVSDGFRDFVLEQLRGLRGVTVRRMFGGAGLYKDGLIFAVLDDDQVFFKVDDATRPGYQKAGSRPFQPVPGEAPSKGYFEVPAAVLEDSSDAVKWAREAVAVSKSKARAKKTTRTRKAKKR